MVNTSRLNKPWKTESILSADGQAKLRVGLYCKDPDKIERWVVFANGRSEYIEKYPDLPRELKLADEVGFLTWDHQGQGMSGGSRSHIDTYETFAKDCELVVRKYVGAKPYICGGHSMGALIVLYSALSGRVSPDAIFLCSPLLKLPARPINPILARKICAIAHQSGLSRISTGVGRHNPGENFIGNRYTHCKITYDHILKTPYGCPGASFGWVNAAQQALDLVFMPEHVEKLQCPVQIIGGSREVVVDLSGWRQWIQLAQRYSSQRIEFRMIPGAKHELFSEITKYRMEAVRIIGELAPEYFTEINKNRLKSA